MYFVVLSINFCHVGAFSLNAHFRNNQQFSSSCSPLYWLYRCLCRSFHSMMAKVLNCDREVSQFEPQSCYDYFLCSSSSFSQPRPPGR